MTARRFLSATAYLGSALRAQQAIKPRFTEAEQLGRNCKALNLFTRRMNDWREQHALDESDRIAGRESDEAEARAEREGM